VPEWAKFKILFGLHKCYDRPSLDDVFPADLVRVRCIRTEQERLARLDDGSLVTGLGADR
jgi:hypothetical protein